MNREKQNLTEKSSPGKFSPFAFRRIHSRELYQPGTPAENNQTRVVFRVNLSHTVRRAN